MVFEWFIFIFHASTRYKRTICLKRIQKLEKMTSFRLGKGVIGNDFGDGVLVEKAVDSPLLGKGQTW